MLNGLFDLSNYSFNPYAIPNIVAAVFCFFLGLFVLMKKKKEGLSLSFAFYSTGIWLFSFGLMYSSNSPAIANLWDKIAYSSGVCFISVSTFFFSLDVTRTKNNKKEKVLLYVGYFIMAVFAIITAFTDLIVEFPPRKYFWGYYTNPGVLHHIFFLLWVGFGLKGPYTLYRAYMNEEDLLEKNRIKIFLISFLFGYIGASDFLAAYGIEIYPVGYIFISVNFSLIAYNFIKYKALGIETVIHKTFLWLTSILFIVLPAGIIASFISKILTETLPTFLIAFIFSAAFLFFHFYYGKLRPKIDYLFGKRQYAYYELLGRISETVSTTLDIEEFSQKLLNELDACIFPQKIDLWLVDEKKHHVSLFAGKNATEEPRVYAEGREIISGEDLVIKYLKDTREVLEPPIVLLNPKLHYLKGSSLFSFLREESIEVVVPLVMEEKLIGILGLGRKRSLRLYAKADIEILKTLGEELGTGIYNALHHQDVLDKQRLQQEILLAKNIQENLLPQETPEIPGICFYGLYVPSREIGGDYYDFIQATDGGEEDKETLYITIGDVSGKGLDAGLIMAVLKTSIANLSKFYSSPSAMLRELNNFLYNQVRQQKFVSLLLFNYSPRSPDRITYSSAGHEHILIYRKSDGKNIEVIKSGGIILGMLEDIENLIEEHTITLNRGDKILLYTDGVTEARNPQEELFGLPNLIESFRKHARLPVKDTVHNINRDIKEFISSREQYDDITLVGIQKE